MTRPGKVRGLPEFDVAAWLAIVAAYVVGYSFAPGNLARAGVGLAITSLAFGLLALDRAAPAKGRPNERQRRLAAVCVGLVVLALIVVGPGLLTNLVCFGLIYAFGWTYSHLGHVLRRRPTWPILIGAAAASLVPLAYGYASGGGKPVWWIAVIALGFLAARWSLGAIGEGPKGERLFSALHGDKATVRISFVVAGVGYFGVLATLAMLAPNPWFTLGLIVAAAPAGADLGQRRLLLREASPSKMDIIAGRGLGMQSAFTAAIAVCMLTLSRI